MDNTDGWAIDVDLIVAPMAALGWQVTPVKWRSESPDWNKFDAVYVGVPWDYPEDPARFDALVDVIDRSSAVLVNESRLLRWGMGKTYLRDLESRGVPIVPSLWPERVDRATLQDAFERFASERLIVKPVVGANAVDTFVVDAAMPGANYDELLARLQRTFADRACLVQPFIGNIVDEGEYSLFFMGGEYSHAIRKVPKKGDFRVQEEHGADIEAIAPDDALLSAAEHAIANVTPTPVYARIDLVRDRDGEFVVMELELVEPSLYLRLDENAAGRFARAFDSHIEKVKAGELS